MDIHISHLICSTIMLMRVLGKYFPLVGILTMKNVSRKIGEAQMNGLLDAKKGRRNWPYPHGERREVMIVTLRWQLLCRLFRHGYDSFLTARGGEGAGRGGKFY